MTCRHGKWTIILKTLNATGIQPSKRLTLLGEASNKVVVTIFVALTKSALSRQEVKENKTLLTNNGITFTNGLVLQEDPSPKG